MSVRRRNWRDADGTRQEVWMVDIKFQHPDGRVERVRKVSPVQTRRGAEAYERDVRQALLGGTHGRKEDQNLTVSKFAEEFLTVYAETNNKPSEVESKRMILNLHLVPAMGRLRLEEIGQRHIEAYKSRKAKEGLKAKTINNHLAVLGRMLGIAVEWGFLEHQPKVRWLKTPEPQFDFLSFEEAEALLHAVEPEWLPMILTALHSGLRLGELLGLRWSDVDLEAKRIFVCRAAVRGIIGTPKSGKSREVPLTVQARDALRAHRHLKGELVFCDERGGLLTKGQCRWPVWRACDEAQIRRIGWHVFRHTTASHLVMRGAQLKAVQEILGHSDIRITMRYAHLSPDVNRQAIELLERGTYGAHGIGVNERSNGIV